MVDQCATLTVVKSPKLKSKALPVAAFAALGVIALQIPFTKLLGAEVRFTLFDFFAPITGGLFGPAIGAGSIFVIQLVNFVLHGAAMSVGSLIRFFPTMFAAWYFSSKRHYSALISAVAILAFVAHPIGRTVWYYSLFWVIPIAMSYFKNKSLLARALGSTFTAHAVGGAAWIWAFNLPASLWNSLIPIVILERSVFTLGIVASYLFAKQLIKALKLQKVLSTA